MTTSRLEFTAIALDVTIQSVARVIFPLISKLHYGLKPYKKDEILAFDLSSKKMKEHKKK